MKKMMISKHISLRAYHKIVKVARTIADIRQDSEISKDHIAEALQYIKQLGTERKTVLFVGGKNECFFE